MIFTLSDKEFFLVPKISKNLIGKVLFLVNLQSHIEWTGLVNRRAGSSVNLYVCVCNTNCDVPFDLNNTGV